MKNIFILILLGVTFLFSCTSQNCVSRVNNDCVCTEDYTPVCGCDGITYSNLCKMQCAGVTLEHEGACQ